MDVFTYCVCSDTGSVRKRNEDSYDLLMLTLPDGRITLFSAIVCDGMGGHPAGDVASSLACSMVHRSLLELLASVPSPTREDVIGIMGESVHASHRRLSTLARSDPSLQGMGTTLIWAIAFSGEVFLAHVGDSRAYVWGQKGLCRATRDQTPVQRMVDRGELTPSQARAHPLRHVVSQAFGLTSPLRPCLSWRRVAPGEGILLCSDGLTDQLTDDEIGSVLAREGENACDKLVAMANERGGRDNCTVAVLRCDQKG
ncbi:serine/threonine-protein phosphatase [archaeon]|nr:MAG: serine/threonine-protein phosphatase [archaeon]